jgi:hypothetical protein
MCSPKKWGWMFAAPPPRPRPPHHHAPTQAQRNITESTYPVYVLEEVLSLECPYGVQPHLPSGCFEAPRSLSTHPPSTPPPSPNYHSTYPVYVLEEVLALEGPYGVQPRKALCIVLEDGAEGQSIKTLQLTRRDEVQALNPASTILRGERGWRR